ncbi:hypothetical protein [Rahnella aceris]|jgi:hypothetical protein|uniref:hypothetical protein n=1 Tax=Rahnella sp. (strain Y9602) TaxID=2703885 RepID=UPI003B9FA113
MYLEKIKLIAANILFVEDVNAIDSKKSFEDNGFTSIDFIDFCFEVESQIDSRLDRETLWPFPELIENKEMVIHGKWTEKGRELAAKTLGVEKISVLDPDNKEFSNYWTPEYCAQRVAQVLNG